MVLVPLIEWVWTLLAVTGVLVCAWVLIDGYKDLGALREMIRLAMQRGLPIPNGNSVVIVRMNLRAAHAGAILHTFFLLLGLLALRSPDPEFSLFYGLLGSGYILVAATNVRALILNQIDRVRMRRNGGDHV